MLHRSPSGLWQVADLRYGRQDAGLWPAVEPGTLPGGRTRPYPDCPSSVYGRACSGRLDAALNGRPDARRYKTCPSDPGLELRSRLRNVLTNLLAQRVQ
jgi:hypothetical protein